MRQPGFFVEQGDLRMRTRKVGVAYWTSARLLPLIIGTHLVILLGVPPISTMAFQLPPQTPGTVSYVNFDILAAIYTGPTASGQFIPSQVQSIYTDLAEVRAFYWRNSRGAVNLTVTFLEIMEPKSSEDFDGTGIKLDVVSADLQIGRASC